MASPQPGSAPRSRASAAVPPHGGARFPVPGFSEAPLSSDSHLGFCLPPAFIPLRHGGFPGRPHCHYDARPPARPVDSPACRTLSWTQSTCATAWAAWAGRLPQVRCHPGTTDRRTYWPTRAALLGVPHRDPTLSPCSLHLAQAWRSWGCAPSGPTSRVPRPHGLAGSSLARSWSRGPWPACWDLSAAAVRHPQNLTRCLAFAL